MVRYCKCNTWYWRFVYIVTVAGFFVWLWKPLDSDAAEIVVSPLRASERPATPLYELHILFFGNSYTRYNDMIDMIVRLADSDPDNHTRFIVQSVTRAGAALKDLLADGAALKLLHERRWDYVVLQENSLWAMSDESIDATTRTATLFNHKIKQVSANTLLYGTWARKPGSGYYRKVPYGPVYMQQQIDEHTDVLGNALGAVVIPVGDYWASALQQRPGIPLYVSATHPTPTGSYLTALLFYRYFSGHNPDHVTYVPDGVPAANAAFLRCVVSY